MKILYTSFFTAIITLFSSYSFSQAPFVNITAVMDFDLPSTDGKAVMLTANQSIPDLSIYSIRQYSNGNLTSSLSETLPAT